MTKEQDVEVYLMNKPQVIAEMLYETIETIERYEKKIKEYEEMINWMEENSNTSLCDYYNGNAE